MFKKILSFTLATIMMLSFAGCGKKEKTDIKTDETSSISEPSTYINPLTGESTDKEIALQRSVAIMVNNISIAQPVQTGLTDADIIYETEVEGGITRLLALYKDLKSVKQFGTVRSARYAYIDLAAGHNAVYIHHGKDVEHALPHFNVVDRIELQVGNGGERISNGLSSEHTLYGHGDKLWETIKNNIANSTLNEQENAWVNFEKKDKSVKYDNAAESVTVPFSASYKTTFKYNAETGRYTRYFGTTERKDYNTKESVTVKNVFVLNTTIGDYANCQEAAKGKSAHKDVKLTSGSGYYFANGTYTKINWTKGDAKDGFKFTKEDGSELKVNVGNSWVCIADKDRSQPVIE